MKNTNLNLFVLGLTLTAVSFTACKKENPVIETPSSATKSTLDSSYYPGLFSYYLDSIKPVFTPNTNTERNALLEHYEGHRCPNCDTSIYLATSISNAFPNRAFDVAVHASPGDSVANVFNHTTANYPHDHTSTEGNIYSEEFENGFGFFAIPMGNVNRSYFTGPMFDHISTYLPRVQNIMADPNLKVNIQSVFNYYSQTNGGYLHVETELLASNSNNYNIVAYVVQDSIVAAQLTGPNVYEPNFIHRNVLIGTIDNAAWGQQAFPANTSAGTSVEFDYAYGIPSGYNADNLHILVYVYDTQTYEVLQVIYQDIN